jgi:hypothetical protein
MYGSGNDFMKNLYGHGIYFDTVGFQGTNEKCHLNLMTIDHHW